MTYKKENNKIFFRLDKGENIFDSIYDLISKENITSGWINGIGAIDNVSIGSYNLKEKKYYQTRFEGIYELTSLMGNISIKEGSPFLHMHANISNELCESFGGHLFDANIYVSGEFIIYLSNININRKYDDEVGLFVQGFNNCE